MKKIISALIITALLLSSILAIIPVAAEEASEQRVNMAAGSSADQNAGIAPSFYYDYHLYKHGVDIFPVKGAHAKKPYVLSAVNAAQGSATINDGSLETYKDAYKGFQDSPNNRVVDNKGTEYIFDAWVGICLKETTTIDAFKYYTLSKNTQGSKTLVEEVTIFGAKLNPETHTYDPNSWFRMADTFKGVQENLTEDERFAVVSGNLYMPFDVDYVFLGFMMEGDSGGEYVNVELELYEYVGGDQADLDLTAINEAIAFAEAELAKENTYTTNSYNMLNNAYEEAKAALSATNQMAVDYAATNLYDAIAALALRGDTTALEAELAKYADAVEAKYTTSSWAAFVAARDAASALITEGNASDDAAATHLEALAAAGAGLAEKATAENIAALKAKYEEAKALDKDLYTPQTMSALNVAMRDANALTKEEVKDDVSVAQYETAMKAMTDAFAALKEKADMSALQAALDEVLSLSASNYTKDSFSALASAITAAQQFLSDNAKNATAEEANALIAAISSAKEALVELADLTALNAKIAEAEALKEAEYSADTWKALQTALTAAKAITADATQAQADETLAALEAAVKALAAAPKATEPTSTEAPAEDGCGGVIGATAVVIAAVLGLGVATLRRKDN
ncbi:MAG: FIVAR domain-containing protein [Clostridia bacterium]|nr:FIVAR domain-containing protein [Clostridia bacterium]